MMASYYSTLNSKDDKNDVILMRSVNPLSSDLNKIEAKFKEFNPCPVENIDELCDWNRDVSFIDGDKIREVMNNIKEKWAEQIKKHRDIHTAISKFGKSTDKIFSERIDHLNAYFVRNNGNSIGTKAIAEYSDAVNSLIFDYLLRVGRVEVASVFLEEESVNLTEDEHCVLAEVTLIISSMKLNQFAPVKEWITYNKGSMTESQIIKFQYIVSKLEFLNTLATEPSNFEALIDCAKRMAIYARFFQPDFEYLMGSLAFIHSPERIKQFYSELFLKMADSGDNYPNSYDRMEFEDPGDLLSSSKVTQNIIHSLYYQHYLNELISMFSEQVCAIKQCTPTDPLLTLFTSGMRNLTEFFNHDQIFKKLYLYNKIEDFPLTVKRHDHHFHHSIFHCPVDKAVASGDNSVLRLKCGHAISRSAFNQLTKNEQKTKMKCPYCPTETKTNEVLTLIL